MELGDHSEVNIQLALDDVAEGDIIREPKLISRLNKFPIAEIFSVDYQAIQCTGLGG